MYDVLNTPWEQSIRIELKVAKITREQEIHGWYFDIQKALEHIKTLQDKISWIDSQIVPNLPNRKIIPDNSEVSFPFKKNGELSERIKKYFGDDHAIVCGPFSKVSWVPFDLGSEQQIKEYLLSVGWKPTEWNFNKDTKERTSPKLTEDSYGSIREGLGKLISDRMTCEHRLNLIIGLVNLIRPDGRIPAEANTVGTPTGRMRHSKIVNIPKAKPHVFFGAECRELFCVPDGKVLLGVDAKGLENRMLAHYMNDPEFTKIILEGDFHTTLWNTIRDFVDTRDTAKNVGYALFYGAGDEKLAKTADKKPIGWTYRQAGEAMRRNIMAGLPALDRLTIGVKNASRKGWLRGLDGRKIRIRSEHAALNSLLQSAGAIVMKVALCYLYDWIKENKLDAHIIGNFHDEFCIEVDPKDVDKLKELCYNCISKAGEHFKLNVRLDADVKVGKNWKETH